jgi:hypothetical protein
MHETTAETEAARFVAQYLRGTRTASGQPLETIADQIAEHMVSCDLGANEAESLGLHERAKSLRATYRKLREIALQVPVATVALLRALAHVSDRAEALRQHASHFGRVVRGAYDNQRAAEARGDPDVLTQFDPILRQQVNGLEAVELAAVANMATRVIAADADHPGNGLLEAVAAACVSKLVMKLAAAHYVGVAAEAALRNETAEGTRPVTE